MRNQLKMISVIVLLFCFLAGCKNSHVWTERTDRVESLVTAGVSDEVEKATETILESGKEKGGGGTAEAVIAEKQITGVEIRFDYTRMSGKASNQIALWVEDESGHVIKNIYVSDFTARRRGYLDRKDTLNHWVAAEHPGELTDEEIDAISSPTLKEENQSFLWDLSDDEGRNVHTGVYYIKLEGTIFWSSNVLYTGKINLEDSVSGVLNIFTERSEPENQDNESMIRNVEMRILCSP